MLIAVSPQGRLHQVEYALEAIKQGSAVVGLRSKDHAVLVALKRAPSELASYQRKMLKIDHHIGIGFAGLTSDARVLSNYMRQLAMSSRMMYARALPLSRMVSSLSDRAQLNTMQYGKRPYGVGFLIIGVDDTGPHLYEFNPTGNCFEYYAMSLGARSQSAKTYLERHYVEFPDADRDALIRHGIYALRETLQQNKEVRHSRVRTILTAARARRRIRRCRRATCGRRPIRTRRAHCREAHHLRGRGTRSMVQRVRRRALHHTDASLTPRQAPAAPAAAEPQNADDQPMEEN